jgi:hypothetical protein
MVETRSKNVQGAPSLTDDDRSWITEQLRTMETQFQKYVDERVEITETKLLTAFHNWASPSDARQRTHAAALRAIDLEMESLSERVGKLEGQKPQ